MSTTHDFSAYWLAPRAAPAMLGENAYAPHDQTRTPLPAISATRPNILYLTHRVPYPPDKGDRIRTYHLLRQLAKRGRVWLGCLADEPVSPETLGVLRGLCERVAVAHVGRYRRWVKAGWSMLRGRTISEGAFASPELAMVIRQWASEASFSTSIVSASALVPYLREPALSKSRAIVDLIDVDSQKWYDFAEASSGLNRRLYRLEASRVRKLERSLSTSTEAVSVVSSAEAAIYNSFTQAGAATVATNGVDLEYFQPSVASVQPAVTFVGALDYLPNEDAAVWFARSVWPTIHARYPSAEFRIIGRNPTQVVRGLKSIPSVNVVGQVADVRPFLATSSVVVAPLRVARGVQNKVLEALAMGKAVVAAPVALTAFHTKPGVHLLSASDPCEWVEAIGGLLDNPEQRRLLGLAGRRYVEENHHWGRCLQPLLDVVFSHTLPCSVTA